MLNLGQHKVQMVFGFVFGHKTLKAGGQQGPLAGLRVGLCHFGEQYFNPVPW